VKIMSNYSAGYINLKKNIESYSQMIFHELNIKAQDIRFLDSSVNAIIVRFLANGKEFALKVPSNKRLLHEVFFINTLKQYGVQTLDLVHVDLDCKIIPHPFFIAEWIMLADSFEGHYNDSVAYEGGVVYGTELTKVHVIPTNGYGLPLDINGERWSAESMNGALKNFLHENIFDLQANKTVSNKDLEAIYSLTVHNQKLNSKSFLLIGDIPNALMQISPSVKVLAFNDPSGILSGNPLYDLSSMYFYNENADIGTGFMKGFTHSWRHTMKVTPHVQFQFDCFRLFHLYWKTCFFNDHKWNYQKVGTMLAKHLEYIIKNYT